VTTFGDFEDDDAFDTSPPDPEAVARIFVAIEYDLAPEGRTRDLDNLDPNLKALLVFAFSRLLLRLKHEGAI
jgi:hypothetical protein